MEHNPITSTVMIPVPRRGSIPGRRPVDPPAAVQDHPRFAVRDRRRLSSAVVGLLALAIVAGAGTGVRAADTATISVRSAKGAVAAAGVRTRVSDAEPERAGAGGGSPEALAPAAGTGGPRQPGLEAQPLELAEAAYRARRYDEALDRFGLLAAGSDHPFAWLRIGNIWHRRGQVAMAMDAYGRARDSAAALGHVRGLRERAIMNIGLLSLEQARRALVAVGPVSGADPRWQREMQLRLAELGDALGAPQVAAEAASAPVIQERGPRPAPAGRVAAAGGVAGRR